MLLGTAVSERQAYKAALHVYSERWIELGEMDAATVNANTQERVPATVSAGGRWADDAKLQQVARDRGRFLVSRKAGAGDRGAGLGVPTERSRALTVAH